jgi:hypothetical protein
MTLKAAVVCGLSALALGALVSLMGGPSTIIGGGVALKDDERVTAKAVGAQPIAPRAVREVSGYSRVRDPSGARLARSEPDTGVEDPAEITLRASQEPMLEELALQEAIVSSDPEEDTDDPQMITLRASLEPVLEQAVR